MLNLYRIRAKKSRCTDYFKTQVLF